MNAPELPVSAGPDVAVVRRAVLSVSDKTGIVAFAEALARRGVEIVSTGGTGGVLAEAGLAVVEVGAVTGWPEMMGGRVKTLHPTIHGGLLALRDDPDHLRAMAEHGIAPIDLLVVDLYPFERVSAASRDAAETIETIDIGGPAMIRAGAKNAAHVTVVVDPGDYDRVVEAIDRDGGAPRAMRFALAAKAFARTAAYDAAIAAWHARAGAEELPERLVLSARLEERLRYGENPHQAAALYLTGDKRPGVAAARQAQGKALSYNNIGDADAALELVAEFAPGEAAAIAIVKHANPCGAAIGETLADAYRLALRCDPVSAYGGVVAANRPLDAAAARAITGIFTEVVVAPDADEEALAIFAEKLNLRLLLTGALPDPASPGLTVRSVAGGLLAQARDAGRIAPADFQVVTKRPPRPAPRRRSSPAARCATPR